jgi:DNA polymerase III subunit delta'
MDLFVANNVLQIFEKEIENDVSQSFLFYGDRGLGVFYAAKVFARSLVCENKVLGCCENCYFCKESLKNCYDEIIVLEKETDSDSIKVEGVKKIYKKLYYKPQYGRKKILIIKDAEKLTNDAQAALLKIIEEPKKNLIIILVSSNKESLLDTILSRVICVNFFKPNKKETIKFLENRSLKDREFVLFCVEYFNNMVADCVRYLENDDLFLTEKENILSFIKLYKSSFYEASLYIKEISS